VNKKVATFLSLSLAGFLLMASYGIARPLANSLFLQHFDSTDMLWGMALVPVLVTLLLWPYGLLLSKAGPRWTLALSTLLSIVLLALPVFWPNREFVFFLYIWKEAYVVLLVEQFWAFANSTYSVKGGKRAYGPVLFIGGLGAVTGNQVVSHFSTSLGTWAVYEGSMLFLVPFCFFMLAAFHYGSESFAAQPAARKRSGGTGIGLLASSPYLLSIAAIIGLGQVMAATLDVTFHAKMSDAVTGLDQRSAFEGQFWSYVNAGSMLMQLVTPIVLKLLSVRLLHMLIPLTHMAAVGALLLFPSLATAGIAFAWFKILDYSLFRACKEVLYVPLDFDARYRAKMVIDMVVYRTTKGSAALLLSLVRRVTAVLTAFLPVVAGLSAILWVLFALKIGQDFAKLENVEENSQEPAGGT